MKTGETELVLYTIGSCLVLSYKNTPGYVNNNMFTTAIRKINKPRDPCQVLRTTTEHVSVLISLNAHSHRALPPHSACQSIRCFPASRNSLVGWEEFHWCWFQTLDRQIDGDDRERERERIQIIERTCCGIVGKRLSRWQ